MKNNVRIGSLGEEIALKYLEVNNYEIIERNFRRPWGELDIVARSEKGVVVFVEVKAINAAGFSGEKFPISPEDNMSRSKIFKTKKIAETYANSHPEFIDESKGWRIDLIAIKLNIQGEISSEAGNLSLTELRKYCEIKHFENVE